jgi:hypothetical protein
MEMITMYSGMKINLGCQQETILPTVFLEPKHKIYQQSLKQPQPLTNPTREQPL